MTIEEINTLFTQQKSSFLEIGKTNAKERASKLKELEVTILKHRAEIAQAIFQDFRKPETEVELSEIFVVLKEIRHARKNIRNWVVDTKVHSHLGLFGTRSWIRNESKGVALVISPWNFPFNLSMCAVVSAVAAGCCVVLKPSEYTPHVNKVIRAILSEVFNPHHVCMIEGDANVSTELLKLPFNHIHFTGSPKTGKIVMKAAAEHLSSVTLELGGKCPVIIDKHVNINQAAMRIAWAKCLNAGQVCLAPDYLIVHAEVRDQMIKAIEGFFKQMFNGKFTENLDYCGIINSAAADRIEDLAKSANAKINRSKDPKTGIDIIQPLIIQDIDLESRIMEEEIFGPLLPVCTFQNEDELLSILHASSRPLASYVFSKNKRFTDFVIQNTRSGATCINELTIHFNNPNLPFGGINGSGIGKSHGLHGYQEFTNQRSILKQTFAWNSAHLIAPPYSGLKKFIANFVVKYF
jgi:aldehyde dehydrogenase (NAD+)